MYVWTYALDDHVERNITDLAELDDLFGRCEAVVRSGQDDYGHPLLSALSVLQRELTPFPLYPPLSELWAEKFSKALAGLRYDWIVGRARDQGNGPSDVQEYLSHADSVLAWMVHFPRWITDVHHELLDYLDTLVPALNEIVVAIRLANDLATFSWERTQSGQNNILMYDTSSDWVRAELARRAESVRRQLAPLVHQSFLPALELLRFLEWAISFYSLADFRGWGSDATIPEHAHNAQP